MTWDDAMRDYGNDKPDIRFGMKLANMKVSGDDTWTSYLSGRAI
jgi:aspartyl-tRNA synthetase